MKSIAVSLLLLVLFQSADARGELRSLDNRPDALDLWESHSFEGETLYRLKSANDGAAFQTSIHAHSEGSASGLVRKLEVDLNDTPYLNWRWRVEQPLATLRETSKQGDDYAARVYVIVSGGWLFWRTKALNFVWSSRQAKGQIWPNAFAPDNARMIALRDSLDKTGVWYDEKVNVRTLLSQWLGEDVQKIHAVALMTDTDNSGGSAKASYSNIYFSKN